MKNKALQTVGFRFKWLAKSSLGPLFWRVSRAQWRALLKAHPGSDNASLKAVADRKQGWAGIGIIQTPG